MLLFCVALYLAFAIPVFVVIYAALDAARKSDQKGIHPL